MVWRAVDDLLVTVMPVDHGENNRLMGPFKIFMFTGICEFSQIFTLQFNYQAFFIPTLILSCLIHSVGSVRVQKGHLEGSKGDWEQLGSSAVWNYTWVHPNAIAVNLNQLNLNEMSY